MEERSSEDSAALVAGTAATSDAFSGRARLLGGARPRWTRVALALRRAQPCARPSGAWARPARGVHEGLPRSFRPRPPAIRAPPRGRRRPTAGARGRLARGRPVCLAWVGMPAGLERARPRPGACPSGVIARAGGRRERARTPRAFRPRPRRRRPSPRRPGRPARGAAPRRSRGRRRARCGGSECAR